MREQYNRRNTERERERERERRTIGEKEKERERERGGGGRLTSIFKDNKERKKTIDE